MSRMVQWRLTLTLSALYLLVVRVWTKLEINMEDRLEEFLDKNVEIECTYVPVEPDSLLEISWFVRSPGSSFKERIYYNDGHGGVEEGTFTGRISVNNSGGKSILNIKNVRISDNREFICQVSENDSSEVEGFTRLFVFSSPSSPSIEVEPYVSADSESPEKIATCKIENAYPTPNITWYKDRMPLHPDNDVDITTQTTVNPRLLNSVQSELSMLVEVADKNSVFYCEVTYFVPKGEKMMESEHFSITVHYLTTDVSMFRESPKGLVKEGDRVELRCQGDGNPEPLLIFMHNGDDLKSENGLLVVDAVNRTHSGEYECVSLEGPATSMNLEVHFMDPVVITPEKSVVLDEGDDVSLTCNALSSLSTNAKWYKDGTYLKDGHVLRLDNASLDTAGMYACEVVASDLPDLRKENSVTVHVKGEPVITDLIEENDLDGQSKKLSCTAKGFPFPQITWRLSDNQDPVEGFETVADDVITSRIIINSSSDVTAFCEATNDLGTVSASHNITTMETTTEITTTSSTSTLAPKIISVKPKRLRKEGSGVIIAVIIILILLLAILGSVLYFLYKKGKITCGRSGKQDLTKEKSSKDDFVVEMKSGKSEETVLLQGVNGDKKIPNDQ